MIALTNKIANLTWVWIAPRILSVAEPKASLLNQLERDLPEGLIVDAAWLEERGIASNLRSYYVSASWLEQPVRSVYRRPRGELTWQQVVISLQTLILKTPLVVGGRTALELHGFAHYITQDIEAIHLYGPKKPPGWLQKLGLEQSFVYHNSARLFRGDSMYICPEPDAVADQVAGEHLRSRIRGDGLTTLAWGHWGWGLKLSERERAFLEMLDELPNAESFHQVDMIMQGASTFSPRRLQKLLLECTSVKVKRLFFFFADRHRHAWLERLDKEAIDFGKGKRMLVRDGRLDPEYLITVPKDLHVVS